MLFARHLSISARVDWISRNWAQTLFEQSNNFKTWFLFEFFVGLITKNRTIFHFWGKKRLVWKVFDARLCYLYHNETSRYMRILYYNTHMVSVHVVSKRYLLVFEGKCGFSPQFPLSYTFWYMKNCCPPESKQTIDIIQLYYNEFDRCDNSTN